MPFGLVGRPAVALEQAFKLLLEARQAPAAVGQALIAAGPGRMRVWVDIKLQGIAFAAIGRIGGEFRTVGHNDRDLMVVRMKFWIAFHGIGPSAAAMRPFRRCMPSWNFVKSEAV